MAAHRAWLPVPWTKADAYALKALAAGTANESQQKRAMDWIIRQAGQTYDLSYVPGDPHETSFAEGRRFVGLQIVKLLNLTTDQIEKVKT